MHLHPAPTPKFSKTIKTGAHRLIRVGIGCSRGLDSGMTVPIYPRYLIIKNAESVPLPPALSLCGGRPRISRRLSLPFGIVRAVEEDPTLHCIPGNEDDGRITERKMVGLRQDVEQSGRVRIDPRHVELPMPAPPLSSSSLPPPPSTLTSVTTPLSPAFTALPLSLFPSNPSQRPRGEDIVSDVSMLFPTPCHCRPAPNAALCDR